MYGSRASTTTTISAPSPVQATFRRDRVTRTPPAGRAGLCVATLMTATSGRSGPGV